MTPTILLVPLALLPCLLCGPVPPEELTVRALNTDYSLSWSWPGPAGHTALFTVQCVSSYQLNRPRKSPKWKVACQETPHMSCDLTPLNLHYLGVYTLRVRATVDGLHSEWENKSFAPATDAAVGPPTILTVSPAATVLEVSIRAPQTNNNTSMKEKDSSLYYRFTYWEKDAHLQRRILENSLTKVVLEDLKSWTVYCVTVQSLTIEPNRTSDFTDPMCTSTEGGFSGGKIALIFVASLGLVFLVALGFVFGCFHCHRIFKYNLNPKVTLPGFLDEFHVSPALLHPDSHSDLQCDPLSVTCPSPQQDDSSQRHSLERHSEQSSSEDSGIYTSTREKSASAQSSAPCSGLTNGLLGVQDIDTTQKPAPLIADEGFGENTV